MEPTFFQGIESASQITVSNATGQDIFRQCQSMCNTHCYMQLKFISSTFYYVAPHHSGVPMHFLKSVTHITLLKTPHSIIT